MEKLKFKPLSKTQIKISMDRLTRFKPTEEKYLRVFKDIISQNLIRPKFKRDELDAMPYEILTKIAQTIINNSIEASDDFSLNKKIANIENTAFINDENTKKLLKNKINFKSAFSNSEFERVQNPVKKLLIVEGITEEILLPTFAEICGKSFQKNGVFLISAGGKNQVVKLFYKMSDVLRIPIYVLMDSDAQASAIEIEPKLRKSDKIRLISCGEFEDILPHRLIKRTLNFELKNFGKIQISDLKSDSSMVDNLKEIFRTRVLHDFKKAEFAKLVAKNIRSESDLSEEIHQIIDEVILL